MEQPDEHTIARIERLLGRRIARVSHAAGGYTPAERWVVRFDDDSGVFVKIGTLDYIGHWLRSEQRVYAQSEGEAFLPRCIAWDDDPERPMLVLEDLSGARWPPAWQPGDVDRVIASIERMHRVKIDVPPFAQRHAEIAGEGSWATVRDDPAAFLSLGVGDADWLAHAAGALIAAEEALELEGEVFTHMDLRSDNMCLTADRALIVDWNWACKGNPQLDIGAWLPSLEMEGGPPPESILPDAAPVAAWISGFFASRAGLPTIPEAPGVRDIQRAQLRYALPWAVRALGLAMPRSPE